MALRRKSRSVPNSPAFVLSRFVCGFPSHTSLVSAWLSSRILPDATPPQLHCIVSPALNVFQYVCRQALSSPRYYPIRSLFCFHILSASLATIHHHIHLKSSSASATTYTFSLCVCYYPLFTSLVCHLFPSPSFALLYADPPHTTHENIRPLPLLYSFDPSLLW